MDLTSETDDQALIADHALDGDFERTAWAAMPLDLTDPSTGDFLQNLRGDGCLGWQSSRADFVEAVNANLETSRSNTTWPQFEWMSLFDPTVTRRMPISTRFYFETAPMTMH